MPGGIISYRRKQLRVSTTHGPRVHGVAASTGAWLSTIESAPNYGLKWLGKDVALTFDVIA